MKRALLAALAVSLPAGILAGLPPRYGGDLSVALPSAPGEGDPARASGPAQLEAVRALHATLLGIGPSGQLRPGLLATLPEAEPGGRAFRLRLRSGLRFHDGRPVTAADVAASLARLAASRSPHGWIALPLSGSDEVREGRAAALAGIQVLSDLELRLALDAPFPEFPRALAALPAAVLPRGGPASTGAGPFRLGSKTAEAGMRLAPFDGFWRGRPYTDSLSLSAMDARRAARAFGRGEVDLALRPEAMAGAAARDMPVVTATYALVNGRLGRLAEDLRHALGSLDRTELARLAGGRAVALSSLLPPSVWQAPAAAPSRAPARIAGNPRVALLVAEGNRALADWLQVKLFDRGVRAAVEAVGAEELSRRLAAGAYDVALASLTFTSSGAQPGVLEAAWGLGGPSAARRALSRMGSGDPAAAAAEVTEDLGVVPLLAAGLRASSRAGLEGLDVLADGTVDPGDLWISPRAGREGAR